MSRRCVTSLRAWTWNPRGVLRSRCRLCSSDLRAWAACRSMLLRVRWSLLVGRTRVSLVLSRLVDVSRWNQLCSIESWQGFAYGICAVLFCSVFVCVHPGLVFPSSHLRLGLGCVEKLETIFWTLMMMICSIIVLSSFCCLSYVSSRMNDPSWLCDDGVIDGFSCFSMAGKACRLPAPGNDDVNFSLLAKRKTAIERPVSMI